MPVADKIAWTAAENTLPGECEGYIHCYLSVIRLTYGEYLTRYPKGMYSKQAVQQIVYSLSHIANDVASQTKNYEGPTENSERAEFTKAVKELTNILSNVAQPQAAKALSQLRIIEAGFK